MGGESSASSLAPGFRFHPTDEELVSYYLKRKIVGKPFRFDAISEIDIYKFEPWDLPGQSRLKSRDREWYFFSALDKKYGNGWRTNRATEQGYWKTTGKDRAVHRATRSVGMKKTLVYHLGRAPRGERTNWVMHEYRIEDETLGIAKDAFVLCRIFQKSGTGPKNGEQYGAPFIEEEWDEEVTVPEQEVMANGGSSNGSDEETSLACNYGEEIMENQPFVVTVSFKSLLSEILQKFKLSPPLYGVSQSMEEQFQAWVKIQIDDIEIEAIKFWGALSHKKVESEMDAARTAIRYLKTMFEFEVDDVNLEDIQTYNQHYDSVERENGELRVKSWLKIKDRKAKLCVNVALAVQPVNVELPVNPYCKNGWNLLEDPLSILGEDQKLPISSAENGLASALPVKMEQTQVKNEFLELSDLSNPVDVRNVSDDQATQELSYFAASSNPSDNGESYIEMNDLANYGGADPSGFDLLGLDPTFFDATDNGFFSDEFDFSDMFSDDLLMGDPSFSGEVNTEIGQAYLTFPEPSKPHASEIASSSMQKPEKMEKVPRDVNYNEGWEGSIAKQVSRMLGSIPAPPAFAAEFPTKEATILGQTSTSLSSSSIHVTAGMIHITSSMTVSGNGKDDWLWRKNGGVDILLPYGLTSNETMAMEHLMSSKTVSVVARSSFYLIFLWVLILSVSCKIGSYVYTR
ncbi:hypothetical protein C5167_033677 [Papaver somniferum]|uniref:NAC domain-containing protein n=1 Tax=Papaver somniferum TaxID=3469 RepID=A0A4Y7KB13_PAPSO|nr:hypothetical protein C5167_033677 [Papaver somniferum]